ncbi:hypothetical protein [Intestinibacillus massiliensis]|uniref:hypothetical protein n=1 Tax=Intestinibacillus massiliensis TaxID=1871029 RepID=UPI0013563808|nr:hypothetical protein [Intestinibacillus massiliensis]
MTLEPQQAVSEVLDNIAMSCQMEGLELTDEIRALCLSVLSGTASLQDSLCILNAKYS